MLFEIAVCVALGICAFLYHVYKVCKIKTTFFRDLGVQGPRHHPIYGNTPEISERGNLNIIEEWSSIYGDIFGYFHGFRPILVIRDPELIKQIFIRNFDSFPKRQLIQEASGVVPVNTVKLSRISGDKWRLIRALISPAFKSNKLKQAFPMIEECTDEFLRIMEKDKAAQERGGIDISPAFCRLSLEILLRFTMGARLNVQAASKETEAILNAGRNAARRFPLGLLMVCNLIPTWDIVKKVMVFLQGCLREAPTEMFNKYLFELVRQRREKGWVTDTTRTERTITPFETAANVEFFVIAGLETIASALSFTAHLLAKHQDVQEKVRAEVKSLLEKDGSVNYDNISRLQYLNQVISESLRVYPPIPGQVNRKCVKDFEFNGFRIPKDTLIQVPVRLIHHDPRYWVNPEDFNPDRFSPENKKTIESPAYIPFGIGLRICPAARFAEIALALILSKIVAKFKLHLSDQPVKRTIKYVSPATLAFADGGAWVWMEKI
ncbi:putative cytochrome P450 [Ixodes scapularis]